MERLLQLVSPGQAGETSPDSVVMIPLRGDINVERCGLVEKTIYDLVDGGCKRIIVNMAAVPYIDSAAVALLVRAIKKMKTQRGSLTLSNVCDQVYRTLYLTRLVDYVPVERGRRASFMVLDNLAHPQWSRTFKVDPGHMDRARKTIRKQLLTLPMSDEEVFDMVLASGEAIGNAVDHTCQENIFVTMSGYKDRVAIDVSDCGEGFDLEDYHKLVLTTLERGRGIKLMSLLVDSMSIRKKSDGETGTIVHLVKMMKFQTSADVQDLKKSG